MPRKGPIYETLDQTERVLRAYGVPSRYLRCTRKDIDKLNMHTVTFEREWLPKDKAVLSLSPTKQRRVVSEIFDDNSFKVSSGIVGVGSDPTDGPGMTFGAAVCRHVHEQGKRPMMINTRRAPGATIEETMTTMPDVAVLYNIKTDSGSFRTDSCKDWLTILDDVFTVLIVGGTDPITFFYRRLHHPLDGALYFAGT